MIAPGSSGWLAQSNDAAALQDAIERLLERPEEVVEAIRTGGPLAQARRLTDEQAILESYEQLAAMPSRRHRRKVRAAGEPVPLVSAIVPYYRASRFVRDTIESLLAQTHHRLEIVIVNDGSFDEEDWILGEIAAQAPVTVVTQMNAGLGAARNFGVLQSHGRYVFPLDADNAVEPEFVARCVEVLEADPAVAYVTSWSRYVEADGTPRADHNVGYQPLGNHAVLNEHENVAGDAAAVLRRRLFDAGFRYSEELTSFEDWHLYRELQRAGHFGVVIPERLLRYRLREDSMQAQIARPRRERIRAEINALLRENGVRWTWSSG
jgi:glycosyltransferase involved in cell wall biosynthesis